MDIKKIFVNLIMRLVGGALGVFVAWVATFKLGIPVPILSPEEITAVAGAIGVVGSEALLDGLKRVWKSITS